MNHIIARSQKNARRGIRQHRLDPHTLSLHVFSDSSFSNTPSLRSQLGFIVLLCDASGRCNILRFASYKSKRSSRSVMGAEVLAFADAFDYAYLLRHDLTRIMNTELSLAVLTDSDSLFKTITK